MKLNSMKARGLGSMAACVAAGALGALLIVHATGTAVAQTKGRNDPAPTTRVVYNARYVNQVVPTKETERIREVREFPDSPAFLVRTSTAISVWLREENGLRMLMEIKLDGSFESLVFLDDKRTFIVHTPKSARVFSLNKSLVVEERSR